MSKIFIVSDVHIGSYASKNPTPDYRLYQGSRTVAENIIKVAKREGCDYIAFAGDVIEKAILRPYVLAEVKRFLHRIMSEFSYGWLIYGNHCLDCKSSDSKFEDSLLGVVLPDNLVYAHQTIQQVDNTVIGFSNYQDVFDLSWIPTKVDVLITHATICYAASDFIQSQELDESKFDLAICGDIHKKATIGKYVSIGIPQKCKMGETEEFTGVVLDCVTKEWKWVDLNPDNNLMKFNWTSDISQHGWHGDTMTWLEYRRAAIRGEDESTVQVDNPASNVEELFNQYITANNLMPVHLKVLKEVPDLDAGCIDFDFTLTKFYCRNWRSIEEVTLYFSKGDKVLIVGDNGSGKSSLTSAIKYAFADTKDTAGLMSLNPFIQFGAKDCVTEVEFIYQGNNYRLRRGTKEYGLWINDVPQKYSNKKAFEADARARFPFIQYIDVFFLDADHNQLIGGMSVEKKSLLVSKFFKLDKIDTLHDTAVAMLKLLDKEGGAWKERINSTEEIIKFINTKLSEIQLPNISKADLEKSRLEGMEIQRKSSEWSSFVTTTASLQATWNASIERIRELETEKLKLRPKDIIEAEISHLQSVISDSQAEINNLGSIKVKLDYKAKEIEDLRAEGNKAWLEAQNIEKGSICPTCHQPIQTSEAALEHKKALEQKIEELRVKKVTLDSELEELKVAWENSTNLYQTVSQRITDLNKQVSVLMSEINHISQVERDLENAKNKAATVEDNLKKLVKPEEVYLPDNFMSTMSLIEFNLSAWNSFETYSEDLATRQKELDSYKEAITDIQEKQAELQKYINMTGPTGEIYYEILTSLAAQFSDTNVNYVVKKYTKFGDHLNLESQFNNNGNWVDYAACSSGQKTVLDVHFLQNIVTRLGILVMDEFLKHLDPQNHDICIDMISDMNIGCIMLSSHMESVATFNNKTCKLSLNHNCMSEIDFK